MMKYNVRHIEVPLEKPGFLPQQLQRDTDEGLLLSHSQLMESTDKKNVFFFVPNIEIRPVGTGFSSVC